MNLAVDLKPIVAGARDGISALMIGVLEHFFKMEHRCPLTLFVSEEHGSPISKIPDTVRVHTLPEETFYSRLDDICRRENVDVLFRSSPGQEVVTFPSKQQIVLIPDLQHELFPESFSSDALRMRRGAFNCAMAEVGAVATLTEFTQQAIRKHPWTNCKDVFLFPPALPCPDLTGDRAALEPDELALIPTAPFFFYPAKLWSHRIDRRLISAFRKFNERAETPCEFVLVGNPAEWPTFAEEMLSLPVRHLGFVQNELLKVLYREALAVPFFSVCEEFGIPLLEAFAAETPILCGNVPSMKEVGGDAALYCDPFDENAMTELMLRIASDEELRARQTRRGLQRLERFSWDIACTNVLSAANRLHAHSEIAVEFEPPLVSIVTPSYNQGRFIKATIDSVLEQDYPRIEYLVMDGGSSDETVEILKSYGTRFNWLSEPDGGQTAAINKGFTASKGTVRAYLNSDDVLERGAVGQAVEFFRAHPAADLLYGNAHYIDEAGSIMRDYPSAPYSFERLMRDCCICQPAAFWLKRIADLVGPFDERCNFAMDYEYWLRIDRAGGSIHHLPEYLASSRLYAETKTLSAREQIYEEIFRICLKHGGYVDLNFFLGLWHHRVCESSSHWGRFLRYLPSAHHLIAIIHRNIFHYGRSSAHRMAQPVVSNHKHPL